MKVGMYSGFLVKPKETRSKTSNVVENRSNKAQPTVVPNRGNCLGVERTVNAVLHSSSALVWGRVSSSDITMRSMPIAPNESLSEL